jgi:hypothetical protein
MSFLDRLHPQARTPGEGEPNIAYFVARLGGEGQAWAEEYTRPEHVEIMGTVERAVRYLHARQTEAGRRDLQAAERMLREAASASREVHLLLGRWYYQAMALYFYYLEDFRAADEALDRTEEEVRKAIEGKPFLLPYAMRCYELWCHRIRVARSQRLWPEVRRRAEITRQIVEGDRPCCVLRDGTVIDIAAVKAFYSRFEALTERERLPLRRVVDDESRRRHFRTVLSEIYTLSGFVIPYTPAPTPRLGIQG